MDLKKDWNQIAKMNEENPARVTTLENMMYVIYTSGSTGRPKAIVATHAASANRLKWMQKAYRLHPKEICCQKTSLSFVDSVWEIFGPLIEGVRIVVIPGESVKDVNSLARMIATNRITRIVLVPSLLRALLELQHVLIEKLSCVKVWISSGEDLSVDLAQHLLSTLPQSTLLDLYGSSETAADASYYQVSKQEKIERVPIGSPVDNIQIYVLDESMEPVPVGMAGELYIGGAGLARGYLNRPDLTAERFVPNPFGEGMGGRLYRTGDLGRWRADGNVEFLGRADQQVKIRGYRIEPGEIEAALREYKGIKEAVVVAREQESGEKQLIGYVVVKDEESAPSARDLREHLQQRLPEYMVPSTFVPLKALPLTPNGKLDRKALSILEHEELGLERRYVAAKSPSEELLCGIWRKVLGLEKVGVEDNFFEMGGHSLLATQVISQIRQVFGVEMGVQQLFETPTIAELAQNLEVAAYQQDEISILLSNIEIMSPQEVQAALLTYDRFENHQDLG